MTSKYALLYVKESVKLPAKRGTIGAAKFSFYAKIGYTAVVVVTDVVSNSGVTYPTGLHRKLHGHSLPFSADRDMVLVRATDIIAEFQTL